MILFKLFAKGDYPCCFLFIEFPAEDIGRHITQLTDFLRGIYDTVDSAGKFWRKFYLKISVQCNLSRADLS